MSVQHVYQLVAKGSHDVLEGVQVLRSKMVFLSHERAEQELPAWLERLKNDEHPLAGKFIVDKASINELEIVE